MDARNVRIHLEADLSRFPRIAEFARHFRKVVMGRKGAQKAAVVRFEHIWYAGKAGFSEHCCVDAALRCLASVQTA